MTDRQVDIDGAFREGTSIDEAMQEAARAAARLHKRLGLPLVVWRDGRVVHIPPEEIDVEGRTREIAKESK